MKQTIPVGIKFARVSTNSKISRSFQARVVGGVGLRFLRLKAPLTDICFMSSLVFVQGQSAIGEGQQLMVTFAPSIE